MKKRVFFLLLAAIMMPLAMNAQHNASVHIDTTISACVSYTWPVNGTVYTTSGIETALVGDTLYILDLTINPVYNEVITTPIDGGCTFTWGDSVYHTGGTHTQTFQSVAGCDSTVTINLNLATTASRTYSATACESYTWKGTTYSTTGYQVINIIDSTSTPGCDSMLTLQLTVIAPIQSTYDTLVVACERARFRFFPSASIITVTQDGTVITSESLTGAAANNIFHPRSITKCMDSIVTVTFNIRNKVFTNLTERACDNFSITVNDSVYEYMFSIVDTLKAGKAANGCDSLVRLNLTVNVTPVVTISGDLRVTPGSNATLSANSNQSPMTYLWSTGETSETITINNVQSNTDVSLTGTNTSTTCQRTSTVTVMANAAINDADDASLVIYPNPTNSTINIEAASSVRQIAIYNVMGQEVMHARSVQSLDLSMLESGRYIVRIETENGTVSTRSIILNK